MTHTSAPLTRLYASRASSPACASALGWLGGKLRAVCRLEPNPDHDQRLAARVLIIVGLGCVNVGLAVAASVVAWAQSVHVRRRAKQRHRARIDAALGDTIDLFGVVLASGATVAEAVQQVSEWANQSIAFEFGWCARQAERGRALSDALEDVPARIGPQLRPLISALVATERYGAPISASLAQLSRDARDDRRRRAEIAARKLPVVLLFPLVTCVLPAFLLVTVVPVVFDTLSNFEFSVSP